MARLGAALLQRTLAARAASARRIGAFFAGFLVSHRIIMLMAMLVLASLVGACIGLFLGTSVRPEQIGLMFSLILTPLLFTGCTYYPWVGLDTIKWFQILTLFNPLTYADEGIRYAMVPSIHGHDIPTLDLHWVFLGLGVSIVVFFFLGTRTFLRRVVS